MKHAICKFTAAVLLPLALSCSRSEVLDDNECLKYVDKQMSFTASCADDGRKTVMQSDGRTIFWSPNDSVNVFQGALGSGKFISTNTEPVAVATFSGTLHVLSGTYGEAEEEQFWAVYPYKEDCKYEDGSVSVYVPEEQVAVEGDFQTGAFPAIARSSNLFLSFRNVCSGIVISVSDNGITELSITGNCNEAMAGTAMIGYDSDNLPFLKKVVDSKSTIVLKAPDNGTFQKGVRYYVSVLPVELPEGFSISFQKKSSEGRIIVDKAVQFSRNKVVAIENLDKDVTYHDFVDLGFGPKWATCNIGGETEDDYGDYFSWGETVPKDNYTVANYEFFKRILLEIKKYNTLAKYGDVDNKTVLEPEDDAATYAWGKDWRTPTYAEWKELYDNCTLTIDNVNDVLGWRATSKIQGYTDKSIFLPFRNVDQKDTTYKIYLTSEIISSKPDYERHIHISSNTFGLNWSGPRENCYDCVRSVSKSSTEEDAVDLGLSVKWASRNIGADVPEEFGNTYQYGFTDVDYDNEVDCKYCIYDTTMTKYNKADGKTVLEPEDDAAYMNYGGKWRMPTMSEFQMLIDSCTVEWISFGKVTGVKFTSKVPGFTDKSIVLRAAGSSTSMYSGKYCRYWTSSVYSKYLINSWFFQGASGSYTIPSGRRYLGRPIRPVFDEKQDVVLN